MRRGMCVCRVITNGRYIHHAHVLACFHGADEDGPKGSGVGAGGGEMTGSRRGRGTAGFLRDVSSVWPGCWKMGRGSVPSVPKSNGLSGRVHDGWGELEETRQILRCALYTVKPRSRTHLVFRVKSV